LGLRAHHWLNGLQSALLLLAMALLWGALGWSLAGPGWMVAMVVFGVVSLLVGLQLTPKLVLAMYRARPVTVMQAPALHALADELSARAGLRKTPTLYHVPSRLMHAFSTGSGDAAAIVLSDGLLRGLSWRELAAVLAHELSHVAHRDTWVMALADLVTRMTHLLSVFGQLLLLASLPLWLFTDYRIPWLLVLLLILAPSVSALLQLALSRRREFAADLGAVEITGDPLGLAAALRRLELVEASWFDYLLLPGRRVPEPSLLRTHPPTEERIRRLLALEEGAEFHGGRGAPADALGDIPPATRRPRRNLFGLWY
jgi:heat shock protein HtpX